MQELRWEASLTRLYSKAQREGMTVETHCMGTGMRYICFKPPPRTITGNKTMGRRAMALSVLEEPAEMARPREVPTAEARTSTAPTWRKSALRPEKR